MTRISAQPNFQVIVRVSRSTTTRTPHMRNGPSLKQEENTQGQDTYEDSIALIEDRAHPIKQQQNTQGQDIHADSMNLVEDRQRPLKQQDNHQPQEIHAPQDDISPE